MAFGRAFGAASEAGAKRCLLRIVCQNGVLLLKGGRNNFSGK